MSITLVFALTAGPATSAQLAARHNLPTTEVTSTLETMARRGIVTHTGSAWVLAVAPAEAVSRLIRGDRGDPPDEPDSCDADSQPLKETPS